MKRIFALCCILSFVCIIVKGQNQAPEISQLSVTTDWPNLSLGISYEVFDNENDPLEITLQLSDDGGKTYAITSQIIATGDIGFPIQPGSRNISCDLSGIFNINAPFTIRLIADDKQPFDIQALVNEVDSNRLRANLEFVEGIRHRTAGNAHLNATRDSIQNLFLNAGLHYQEQSVPFGNYTGRNLIGNQPGTSSAEQVVINDAHYDSFINAPGADDNGSGTVGVMEGVRLLSRYPFKKSLRFIGFDLEESGLIGSIRYVSTGIPTGEQIAGVFNYEMIGYWSDEPNSQTLPPGFSILFPDATAQVVANQYRGDFITNVGNSVSIPLAQLFSDAAQQYVPDLKVITINVPGDGSIAPDLQRSDHAPFWAAGKPALMLTDGANFRNECYHTSSDTLDEKLNFTFMSNVVKATIAAMAQLAEIQHGDWATASFQNNLDVSNQRLPLFLTVYQQEDQLEWLTIEGQCSLQGVVLELYDMKGSLIMQDGIVCPDEGSFSQIRIPKLSTGMYIVKFRYPGGVQAQKIILR